MCELYLKKLLEKQVNEGAGSSVPSQLCGLGPKSPLLFSVLVCKMAVIVKPPPGAAAVRLQ